MGYRDDCWYEKKRSKCSGRNGGYYGHDCDDCWKKFEECKKESNQKCDCCCTTGIVRKLRALRGTAVAVAITTSSGQVIEGTVESVDCHTADIVAAGERVTVSVCEIESFSRVV
ncbi:hypothetical protein ACO11K_000806 [Bacillus cytotoxicus]